MSDTPISQDDLRIAWNRCNSIPARYETAGDEAKVQWAARRALAAINRLNLEITIAEERNRMAGSERQAKGHRNTLRGLIRLRGGSERT